MQYISNIKNSLLLWSSAIVVIVGLAMIICGLAISSEFNWLQMSGGFLALAGGTAFTVGLSSITEDEEIEVLERENRASAPSVEFSVPPNIAINLNSKNSHDVASSIEQSPSSSKERVLKA